MYKKVSDLQKESSSLGVDNFSVNKKILFIKEDLDLVKALRNNCLNGPVNRMLSSLAQKNIVSEKLRVVFDELQKNGMALPTEMIFFNKSNALLQGIITNLIEIMESQGIDFEYVDPDSIFSESITKFREKDAA